MTDINVKLHAAFLYWFNSIPDRGPRRSRTTDALLVDFNECMEQTGLAPKLGRTAFELLLQSIGLESYTDNDATFWTDVDVCNYDPLGPDRYPDPDFPEIFG